MESPNLNQPLMYGSFVGGTDLPTQMYHLCNQVIHDTYFAQIDPLSAIRYLDAHCGRGSINILNRVVKLSQTQQPNEIDTAAFIERDHRNAMKLYGRIRVGLWCAAYGFVHPGLNWDFQTN